CGYAPGAVVRITLNGAVVLQIVVPNGNPATCTTHTTIAPPPLAAIGPLGHALVHAQAARNNSGATGQFQVPSDTPPGSYLVSGGPEQRRSAAPCSSSPARRSSGCRYPAASAYLHLPRATPGLTSSRHCTPRHCTPPSSPSTRCSSPRLSFSAESL